MQASRTATDSGNREHLLACEAVQLGYPQHGEWFEVVNGLSFTIRRGQTLALVGESGSGKSTIAKALVKLIPVKSGSIRINGDEVAPLTAAEFRPWRSHVQLVFQDPWRALNPRMSTAQLLGEPLYLHQPGLSRRDYEKRINNLLETVHLPQSITDRFPHELSGGQRQRLLLARALAVEPELLICDEPVSALDVSIQAQLLKLLTELKERCDLTLLFISHDLAVVQQIADHVLVLRKGRVVESQPSGRLFRQPEHAYTRMLIEACPKW